MAVILDCPSAIIAKLLIDQGVTQAHNSSTGWPTTYGTLPSVKNNALHVMDSAPELFGRAMTGETIEHCGIQFLIRSTVYADGYKLGRRLEKWFAETAALLTVILDGKTYRIVSFTKKTGTTHIGKEDARLMFSMNGVVALCCLTP